MSVPTFERVDVPVVEHLARLFAEQGRRRIDTVHLHHTFIPNIALFDELVTTLGDEHVAGHELCRRMWRFHTREKGWSDIAQHVTVDPSGAIWLNRPWDRPPVSARGHNGNFAVGPFMIEMIGDFDRLRETPTKAQRQATEAVIAAVLNAFSLPVGTLRFHNELGSMKSCPGSGLDKAGWIESLAAKVPAKRPSRSAQQTRSRRSARAESEATRFLSRVLDATASDVRGYAESEWLGEPDEDRMAAEHVAEISRRDVGASPATRGSRERAPSLSPLMLDQLRPHVVNLRQGRFSDAGDFTSSEVDVERLIGQHLEPWARDCLHRSRVPRVMIHAHGGLNSEQDGLRYAYDLHRWWLDQDVYPIYFVWETGIIETVVQLLTEYARGAPRGLLDKLVGGVAGVRDAFVEEAVRSLGRDFWSIMKLSALRATETDEAGGSFLIVQLAELHRRLEADASSGEGGGQGQEAGRALELHTVGHSAGAIFQAGFVARAIAAGLRVETLSLLAPACTVALFDERIAPYVKGGEIAHLGLFNLDRQSERDDPTVPLYGKSLLHLVSNGFESERDTPLLGMERHVRADRRLLDLLGLAGRPTPAARVVFSPTAADAVPPAAARARTHGGFSREAATLRSVAMRIRAVDDASEIPSPPVADDASRGDAPALFAPLSERLDPQIHALLFGAAGSAAGAGSGAPARPHPESIQGPARGRRTALCIGIDAYPIAGQRLHGCVNDARQWAGCLERLGFSVTTLHDGEATARAILDGIRALVAGTGPDDVVVVEYAGHGIRFEDFSGDEIDRTDEALVPFDNNNELYVSDDELWDVLQGGHEGAHVYVFMDCCHSMTNTRAFPPPGMIPRYIAPTTEMTRNHRQRLRSDSVRPRHKPIEAMKHIKYAACEDAEFAYESDGHGKFTQAAVAAIEASVAPASNHDFVVEIEHAFARDTRQHPGLECPSEIKTRPFLAGIPVALHAG